MLFSELFSLVEFANAILVFTLLCVSLFCLIYLLCNTVVRLNSGVHCIAADQFIVPHTSRHSGLIAFKCR